MPFIFLICFIMASGVSANPKTDCICGQYRDKCYHNVSDAAHCGQLGRGENCAYGNNVCAVPGWQTTPPSAFADGCVCGGTCRILSEGTCADMPLECDPPTPCNSATFQPPTSSPSGSTPEVAGPPADIKLTNPLNLRDEATIPEIIGTLISGAMSIMGGLVLLMFVWGAGSWLTSAGKAEKVKAGAQTMLWAVIGAVVAISSYVILNTVLDLMRGKI